VLQLGEMALLENCLGKSRLSGNPKWLKNQRKIEINLVILWIIDVIIALNKMFFTLRILIVQFAMVRLLQKHYVSFVGAPVLSDRCFMKILMLKKFLVKLQF